MQNPARRSWQLLINCHTGAGTPTVPGTQGETQLGGCSPAKEMSSQTLLPSATSCRGYVGVQMPHSEQQPLECAGAACAERHRCWCSQVPQIGLGGSRLRVGRSLTSCSLMGYVHPAHPCSATPRTACSGMRLEGDCPCQSRLRQPREPSLLKGRP